MNSTSLLCILLLPFLIIAGITAKHDHHPSGGAAAGAEPSNVLELHSQDPANTAENPMIRGSNPNGPHHEHQSESSGAVFFTIDKLTPGRTYELYFPKVINPTTTKFLPREQAESIPVSLRQLPNVMKMLGVSPGSPMATMMEETLKGCEAPAVRGEVIKCVVSVESMLDFVRANLKTNNLKTLTTAYLTEHLTAKLQKYTIMAAPPVVASPDVLACHVMPYPYALFYCHHLDTETRVFRTSLQGENGDRVEALTICHMDTSAWGANHISFQVLGTKPGESTVCHFLPATNVVFAPKKHGN